MTDPPRSARIVLALGIGLGLYTLVTMPAVRPEQLGLATRVYAVAAEAALAGEPIYDVAPAGLSGYTFVYPPVVLLAFLPYGLLGDATLAFFLQTCLTVAAGMVLAHLLLGVVEGSGAEGAGAEEAGVDGGGAEGAGVDGGGAEGAGVDGGGAEGAGAEEAGVEGAGVEGAGAKEAGAEGAGAEEAGAEEGGVELQRLDRVLVAGFVLLSVHTAPTLVNGQVNLVLGLLVAVGFLAAARDRPGVGGAALGLAATVKLFPAAFGAYLLRRRDWRTLLAATATGVGLLVLGLLVFGLETTTTYLTSVVPSETKTGALAADPLAHDYLTVRRQLAALLGDVGPDLLPILAIVVVAPLVAVASRHVETHEDRLLAVLATIVGTLLVLPLEGLYFPFLYFPLVPLLYLLPAGRSRLLLLVGTALTFVNATPLGVRAFLESGLVGPELAGIVESVTLPVFRVILPATVGMWLLLAAAVYWHLRGRTDDGTTVARSPQRDD